MDWNHEETEKRINKMKQFIEEEYQRSMNSRYSWLTGKPTLELKQYIKPIKGSR